MDQLRPAPAEYRTAAIAGVLKTVRMEHSKLGGVDIEVELTLIDQMLGQLRCIS